MTRQKLFRVSLILTMALGATAVAGFASAANGEGQHHRPKGHREHRVLPLLPPLPPLPHVRIDLGSQGGHGYGQGMHRRDRGWGQEQHYRAEQRQHRQGHRYDHDPDWRR
jgi:hypothetical protein